MKNNSAKMMTDRENACMASAFYYCLQGVLIAAYNTNADTAFMTDDELTEFCIRWEDEVRRIFSIELGQDRKNANDLLEINGAEIRERLGMDVQAFREKYGRRKTTLLPATEVDGELVQICKECFCVIPKKYALKIDFCPHCGREIRRDV